MYHKNVIIKYQQRYNLLVSQKKKKKKKLKLRACLVVGFLFLFSKQYENNFQKIECETSF